MAFILADRVQETATANTTVSFTLTGAIASYQSFSAIGNTNTTYYGATDGTNWEVGLGTYSTTGPTLTRTTILSSSNSGSAATFSGTVTVWCDYPAGKQISSDYPNALGVVVPAAGTFTTITGQTEVLRGTGQNYFTNSNGFSTGWSPTFATVSTASAITDPFGGTSTWNLTENTTTNAHYITKAFTAFVGLPYVTSIFAKANTRNFIVIELFDTTNRRAWFNLSTGAVGTTDSGVTASIQSIGNGWYRCSILTYPTSSSTFATFVIASTDGSYTYLGNGSGIYIYGAQLELSATIGTYTATTSTAIFNSPNLSFSNAANIGLESNGALYLQPAGTGALQAQATTSTTVGGNARGTNAVDWQTSRASATQVASSSFSVIGGGANNIASTSNGTTIAGGRNNTSSAQDSFVGGGNSNTASGLFSSSVGGLSNIASGYYGFVGNGVTNSTTSNSAVTTQSGTMNATTAVTLSGSNANIKVGQYITGTSIASETYVAAISGTALTLSKVASGSSTSTLSFYTPHGVVVGGGNNQATGSYSFIGGGGDAGTAANRNVASGDWSFVGGGRGNIASGNWSIVGGGSANSIYANYGTIAGGLVNGVTGFGSSVLGGYANAASGSYSSALGGTFGTTRSIDSSFAFGAGSPISGTAGVSQAALLVLGVETTNATATALRSNTSAAGTTNQVILPNNSAYYFKIEVIAGVTGGGNTKAWELKGAIKRGANAASTAIVGSVTTTVIAADAGASTWTLTATADTTNGGITVTATGQAATTIRWVARCTTTEMTY